jgi:ABC-type Mn2+/Zn2+ transport system permease subunit
MDARLLDVIIGVSGFILLIVLLAVLPGAFAQIFSQSLQNVASYAYLTAIGAFIIFLSGAGYLVNEKIT